MDEPSVDVEDEAVQADLSERQPMLGHNGSNNGSSAHHGPITNADEALDAIGYGPFQTKMFILCSLTAFIDSCTRYCVIMMYDVM